MKKFFTIFILFAIIGLSNAYPQKLNIDSGLVAYYPFNGNANDESGNGNNGTVYGATLTTNRFDVANNAYSFNGTSNYIEVSDNPILRFENSFSISLWVSVASLSHILYNYTLIDKPLGPLCSDSYTIYWNSGYTMNSGYCNLSDCRNNISGPLDLNTWYNTIWVFDKTLDVETLYINGNLISSQPISITIEYDTHTLTMGKGICYEADQEFLDGKLDDIRFYNRALTETEIQQLYHEGLAVPFYSSTNYNIEMYPNPSSDKMIIETTKKGRLFILNLRGQQLLYQEITKSKTQLNISTLPSGSYIVKLVSEKGVQVGKFIKQ
jgi:hypothetical protein